MSNADQEEKIMAARIDAIADAAWKEWAQTHALDNNIPQTCFRSGFAIGYTRGRADAWDLPEVRAEELILGKSYEATNRDGEVRCCFAGMMKGGKTYVFFCGNPNEHLADDYSFRGPLPLGRVE